MCTVLLPPGVNTIAVNKHINININTTLTDKHALRIRHTKPMVPIFKCQAITMTLIKPQIRTYFTSVRTNGNIRDGVNSNQTLLYVFFSFPSLFYGTSSMTAARMRLLPSTSLLYAFNKSENPVTLYIRI